jgi:pimeloyl-ACP methyl ester carboxylesterase
MKKTLGDWSRFRLGLLTAASLLIAASWWQVLAAGAGLTTRKLVEDGVPLRYMIGRERENVPGVVIAHGFGASNQIMLGYGYALAHAGYGVMMLDFDGHAANAKPFDRESGALQHNLDAAYDSLVEQPEIDERRVALLGHSMGGGAVMRAGILATERYQATIAVSATGADITPERPRNLLLMPGEWEGNLVANSREMLAAAGGANDDFKNGRARALVIVPQTEHILVLFSPFAHQTAVDWLNRTFDAHFTADYRDSRLAWFGVGLVGSMLLAIVITPLVREYRSTESYSRIPWQWLSLAIMPFVASGVVALIDRVVPVRDLGGIQVGGALSLWFLIMGLGWLLFGFRPTGLRLPNLLKGLVLFAFLWLAVGAMSQAVWLRWLLVPARFLRWPFMALAYLPWLLAAGHAQSGGSAIGRAGWWLLQTTFIISGLILLVMLVPSLFVVVLALPVVPFLLVLMTIAGAAADHPWAYAIGNALFFGWQMAAYFPYVG